MTTTPIAQSLLMYVSALKRPPVTYGRMRRAKCPFYRDCDVVDAGGVTGGVHLPSGAVVAESVRSSLRRLVGPDRAAGIFAAFGAVGVVGSFGAFGTIRIVLAFWAVAAYGAAAAAGL